MNQTLILVDENDNFLGYAPKEECHAGDGRHHRAFAVLIFNKGKKILLQKRKHKRWDNYWDITGASHTLHKDGRDESYEEAGRRCLDAEWNFSVPLTKILAYNYFERYGSMCENEYCALLVGEYNGKINPNSEHAHGYKWVSLKDLIEDVERHPESYTPWAIIAVRKLMSHQFSRKLN